MLAARGHLEDLPGPEGPRAPLIPTGDRVGLRLVERNGRYFIRNRIAEAHSYELVNDDSQGLLTCLLIACKLFAATLIIHNL